MNKIKVYIDCGHGGSDSGAVNGQNYESHIVLSVGLHLKKLLLETGKFEVKLSRETDVYKTLQQRTNEANSWGADIFISLHNNSAENKSANGLETFCYKFKYRKLADHINNGILQFFQMNNRGVKEGNFHVIRESKMNACLTELAFISNESDLQILLNHQIEFAKGVFKGILDYYHIDYTVPTPEPEHNPLYIVGAGAFGDINNAKKLMNELKAKGIDAYIHIC